MPKATPAAPNAVETNTTTETTDDNVTVAVRLISRLNETTETTTDNVTASVHEIVRPLNSRDRGTLTARLAALGTTFRPELFGPIMAAVVTAPTGTDPATLGRRAVYAALTAATANLAHAVSEGWVTADDAAILVPLFGFVAPVAPVVRGGSGSSGGSGTRTAVDRSSWVVPIGTVLTRTYKGTAVSCERTADGYRLTFGGKGTKGETFDSPTAAAVAASRSVLGLPLAAESGDTRGATNGWSFWNLSDGTSLDDAGQSGRLVAPTA